MKRLIAIMKTKKELDGNIINKFTQIMKTTSKDKHIVKHEKKFKTLQNMFVIFVKNYVLRSKSNIELNHILTNFLQPFQLH
jgi:hypothetical protein